MTSEPKLEAAVKKATGDIVADLHPVFLEILRRRHGQNARFPLRTLKEWYEFMGDVLAREVPKATSSVDGPAQVDENCGQDESRYQKGEGK